MSTIHTSSFVRSSRSQRGPQEIHDLRLAIARSKFQTQRLKHKLFQIERAHVEHDVHTEFTLNLSSLPCFDELDDGVPPPCRGKSAWWKVFNKSHPITNHNPVMYMFGNVGFPKFDRERRFWMGLAMFSTFVSIFVTVFGALALSKDEELVKLANWVHGTYEITNSTTGSTEKFQVYVGLTALVYEHEPCSVSSCEIHVYKYFEEENIWPDDFLLKGMDECRRTVYDNAFGAFTTCATLLFALLGTINRMKASSDANVQKLLGMVTDLCGTVSLAVSMLLVAQDCYFHVPSSSVSFKVKSLGLGPGYQCYFYCLAASSVRALVHWITPTPGRGVGCSCQIPQDLLRLLDVDGDGKITINDFKAAFSSASISQKVIEHETYRDGEADSFLDVPKVIETKEVTPKVVFFQPCATINGSEKIKRNDRTGFE